MLSFKDRDIDIKKLKGIDFFDNFLILKLCLIIGN